MVADFFTKLKMFTYEDSGHNCYIFSKICYNVLFRINITTI